MKMHNFTSVTKGGKKGKRGQKKSIRTGAKNPGGAQQGSIRRPL